MALALESMNWQAWSQENWESWIIERLEERKKVFGSDPDELISSYNREKSHASSYEGRELLELIQNADDSGDGLPNANSVLILLTPKALFVANTGVPFSPEGIKSLMVSDNSPKQLQRGRFIGYKGLGFRSVLGWASSIAILSGKLSVAFSERKARGWLRALMTEDSKVKLKVERVEKEGLRHPIATLSVPHTFDLVDKEDMMTAETCSDLKELCKRGYDTVICLVFDRPEETYEKARKQVENIGPEVLLFLQHLERLDIVTPNVNVSWQVRRLESEVIVNPEGKEQQAWRIFSEFDEIPKEHRRPEQPLVSQYEIKLAVSRDHLEPHRLFVYFPTEVLFPFPVITHTTFELTDNRQHLIESDINKFIAGRLAKLIADSAEKLVDANNPWVALALVTPRGDLDPVLSKLGFEEKLRKEVASNKIVPVYGKRFNTAVNSKWVEGDFENLLIGKEFEDFCLYTEDEYLTKWLADIGVEPIKYDAFKQKLDSFSKTILPMEARAEIIYRLVENSIVKSGLQPPEILVDEKALPIPADAKPLLPPEGKKFSLPTWVQQRIINPELVKLLKDKFKLTRVRELVSKLWAFDIQEYNMTTLVSSIVAETNRRVRKEARNELALRQEMLQTIQSLYAGQKSEEVPIIPETISIILPTRDGKFQPAGTLYLGNEYHKGELLELFYGPLGGPFVGSPAQLGLQGDASEIEPFLCWLGVAELPRVLRTDVGSGEFIDNVLEGIQYPAKFGDTIVSNKDEAKGMYPRMKNASTIDRMESVLTMADPHAVIAWVLKYYENLSRWRTSGDEEAELTIIPPWKQYRRKLEGQTLPSYTLWLLRRTKWLPLANGEEQSPDLCTLAKGVPKEVSVVVGYPAINPEHPLLKAARVDKTALKNALATVGVVTELDELSWDAFYEILLELPLKDPEGKLARSVYRAMISRGGDSDTPSGEKHEKFFKEGRMFGRLGEDKGYFPVTELHYFENPTLPESILKLFPSLDLDRRRGTAKVKRLFGVEPFNPSAAHITIKQFEEHPFSQNFQKEVDGLKPYIYALRVEEDSDHSELRSLRQLEVKLCKWVKCSIHVGKEEKEITLQQGESITVDSVVYLVAEPLDLEKPFIRDEIIADALGDVLSNILRVDIGGDMARLATCSTARLQLLLDKITGGSGEARLKKVEELMKLPIALDEEEYIKPFPVPPIPESPQQTEQMPLSEGESPHAQPEDVTRPSAVGPVSVNGGEQVPILQSREIQKRIKVNAMPRGGLTWTHGVSVNPDRAENLAIEFEKAQGRFAEKVSYFQGSKSYGCDILSFKSKAEMESFKATGDMRLVDRFVEVKGSTNNVGAITLGGNELKCAQDNPTRFCLYRVYEGKIAGRFELVETPNPLGVETGALKIHYEIHPFKTKSSRLWDVVEVDEKQKH